MLDASQSGEGYQVMQLHITNWSPDGHCKDHSCVTDIIAEMSRIQMRTGNRPIVVHCR